MNNCLDTSAVNYRIIRYHLISYRVVNLFNLATTYKHLVENGFSIRLVVSAGIEPASKV